MKVGAIEETITVSGQSPLIDTQSVTQKKSLTQRDDQRAPDRPQLPEPERARARRVGALASQDVGGTGGERYQTLSIHGSRADQMPLVMNGMPYNNMNNTGGGYNTTLVINTGTVQEMTVTTSGCRPRRGRAACSATPSPKKAATRSAALSSATSPTAACRATTSATI